MVRKSKIKSKVAVAGFSSVPSDEELQEAKKRRIDSERAETLQHIDGVIRGWLNVKLIETRIDVRLKQLGLDAKGTRLGEVHILEKFNETYKTKAMLEAELNIDLFNYKESIGAVERSVRYLKSRGFDDTHILDMKTGRFSMSDWLDKQEAQTQ